jgi:IS1 family transposase
MNNLTQEKRNSILRCLTEGCSIRSTSRIIGVHKRTVIKLLLQAGELSKQVFKSKVKDMDVEMVQADEIWSFVYKKQSRVLLTEMSYRNYGDQYIFIAMDRITKLILCYVVGKRNEDTTYEFISRLRKAVSARSKIQLITDGYGPYIKAIEQVFGADIEYAQIVKKYKSEVFGKGKLKYTRVKVTAISKNIIQGRFKSGNITTSHIERQNLTVRMHMRRLTRSTNGFSKKFENLKAAIHLHMFYYNFVRIHQNLQVTPAMQANITDKVWDFSDLFNST